MEGEGEYDAFRYGHVREGFIETAHKVMSEEAADTYVFEVSTSAGRAGVAFRLESLRDGVVLTPKDEQVPMDEFLSRRAEVCT
jgi:hypothetical protein